MCKSCNALQTDNNDATVRACGRDTVPSACDNSHAKVSRRLRTERSTGVSQSSDGGRCQI